MLRVPEAARVRLGGHELGAGRLEGRRRVPAAVSRRSGRSTTWRPCALCCRTGIRRSHRMGAGASPCISPPFRRPMAQALAGLIGREAQTRDRGGHLVRPGHRALRSARAVHRRVGGAPALEHRDETSPSPRPRASSWCWRGAARASSARRSSRIETHCRVTGVNRPEHLIASHCKPWRDSDNAERLDGENGLLLTPSIDHLFDRGFISFENNGELLVSRVAHEVSLRKMGVPVGVKFKPARSRMGSGDISNFIGSRCFCRRCAGRIAGQMTRKRPMAGHGRRSRTGPFAIRGSPWTKRFNELSTTSWLRRYLGGRLLWMSALIGMDGRLARHAPAALGIHGGGVGGTRRGWRCDIFKVRRRVADSQAGRDGERPSGNILKDFARTAPVSSTTSRRGFNLDHVVISTRGIYVVETKTITKPATDAKVIYSTAKGFPWLVQA